MLSLDRDALICDMAETYGIIEPSSLPVHTTAILAAGLRDDSRIKQKASRVNVPLNTLLLASAVDRLSALLTGLGIYEEEIPSIVESLADEGMERKEDGGDTVAYDSPEAFIKARYGGA